MSKVLWHITMSLDGFVAGPGGDMSWMNGYGGDNPTASEVIEQIGALLIGNRTFRGDIAGAGAGSTEGRAYGGAWTGPQFVLAHQAPQTQAPGFTFVTDLADGVAAAKSAAGEKYVSVLGAGVAAQCLEAGLLDEVLVHIVPVLLGDGVRMFSGEKSVRLERLSLTSSPQVTNVWARVVR